MSLFIYKTDTLGRFSALSIAEDFEQRVFSDDKKTGRTVISKARCDSLFSSDIFLESVNVPIEALEAFCDRIMLVERQIRPLDLSKAGQAEITNLYINDKRGFENFLRQNCPF